MPSDLLFVTELCGVSHQFLTSVTQMRSTVERLAVEIANVRDGKVNAAALADLESELHGSAATLGSIERIMAASIATLKRRLH